MTKLSASFPISDHALIKNVNIILYYAYFVSIPTSSKTEMSWLVYSL